MKTLTVTGNVTVTLGPDAYEHLNVGEAEVVGTGHHPKLGPLTVLKVDGQAVDLFHGIGLVHDPLTRPRLIGPERAIHRLLEPAYWDAVA